MAKHNYKRGNQPRKVKIASSVGAGALTPGDVISGGIIGTSTEAYRLLSVNLAYSWSEIASLIDDTLQFGLAHGDYTAAEIEECLEAGGALAMGDKITQERANRLVREIGVIEGEIGSAGEGDVFNDGRKLKTRLNWLMSTGQVLQMWIRNGSGIIWTTGSNLVVIGEMWILDK